MEYKTEEWTIGKLLSIYDSEKLNLNPSYQRNDIWTNPSKRRLMDSIKKEYPLPVFFLHFKGNDFYDMVDGQQRTRAIFGFREGYFKDMDNNKFEKWNKDNFLNYKISVTIISNVEDETLLSDFYYRVNKFGIKLNRPEILKAQYQNTNIQNLINSLADSEEFQCLNIFSSNSIDRMSDLDFIGELLGLIEYDIIEKKKGADNLYKTDLTKDKMEYLFANFNEIVNILCELNSIYPISKTRYKQRSDFYTLWGFVKENLSLNIENFVYFYKILVLIGEDITPSNEKSIEMSNYAFNCVSQSNSKKAREIRYNFFKNLFLNIEPNPNKTQNDLVKYYNLPNSKLVKINDFYTINGNLIQKVVGFPVLF